MHLENCESAFWYSMVNTCDSKPPVPTIPSMGDSQEIAIVYVIVKENASWIV